MVLRWYDSHKYEQIWCASVCPFSWNNGFISRLFMCIKGPNQMTVSRIKQSNWCNDPNCTYYYDLLKPTWNQSSMCEFAVYLHEFNSQWFFLFFFYINFLENVGKDNKRILNIEFQGDKWDLPIFNCFLPYLSMSVGWLCGSHWFLICQGKFNSINLVNKCSRKSYLQLIDLHNDKLGFSQPVRVLRTRKSLS